MANLYRKPVFITDPKTGQKIKSPSKKWWGQFKDANGKLRRHPLAVDKMAAQAMLNELVRQVEREKAGIIEPGDRERRRPIGEHVTEFRRLKENRDISEKQVSEVLRQLERIVNECKWRTIADIKPNSLVQFLGDLRTPAAEDEVGIAAQTYNHYLRAAKQFTRWLVRDKRLPTDPLVHLSNINTKADRRHDRRALTYEEFTRLTDAARAGKKIESVTGRDRAMLYVLAGWTGFRKGELGSLTKASFRLDDTPPSVTVAAGYSKRRREDTQILHPEVVAQLRTWLATKPKLAADKVLFRISKRAGGIERKTNKMVRLDLARARRTWLKESMTLQEREHREASDFLCYQDHAGLFADFHSLRHFFITSLERSGVSPKMAQTLARHSDIRLTLGVYTHVALHDQAGVIESLPGPSQQSVVADVARVAG